MTKRTRPGTDGKLELLPVMNLVTILIPMLLAAAQLAEIATIDSTAPAIRQGGDPSPTDDPALVLKLTSVGVDVIGAPEELQVETSLRCAGDVCARAADYPLAALTGSLAQVKETRPDDQRVIIEAAGDVPYEVLVAVMDAARADEHGAPMFPRVVVGGAD